MLSPTLLTILLLIDFTSAFQPEFLQMIKQRADLTNNVRRPSRFRCRHPIANRTSTATATPDLPLMLPSIGRGSISFSRGNKATGSAMKAPQLDPQEMELVRRILTEDFPRAMAAGRDEEPSLPAKKRISADGKVPKKVVGQRVEFTTTQKSEITGKLANSTKPGSLKPVESSESTKIMANRTEDAEKSENMPMSQPPNQLQSQTESLLPNNSAEFIGKWAQNQKKTKAAETEPRKAEESRKSLKSILYPRGKIFQRPLPRPLETINEDIRTEAERPNTVNTEKTGESQIEDSKTAKSPKDGSKSPKEESQSEKIKSTTEIFVLAPSTEKPLTEKSKPSVDF